MPEELILLTDKTYTVPTVSMKKIYYKVLDDGNNITSRSKLYKKSIKFEEVVLVYKLNGKDRKFMSIFTKKKYADDIEFIPSITPGKCSGVMKKTTAKKDLFAHYINGVVEIPKGEEIWMDGPRVIIGWHGSYSPPRNMGGEMGIIVFPNNSKSRKTIVV